MSTKTIKRAAAALALTLVCLSLVSHSAKASAGNIIQPSAALYATAPAYDCEGDACAQVAVTFDAAKDQYRVQNNSTDHWVKVSVSNLAAYASACIGPGKSEHLPLKSIVGAYHADYAEARCGEQGGDK